MLDSLYAVGEANRRGGTMSLDVNSLLEEVIAKAKATATAQVENQAKAEAADRASKVDAWKQQLQEREAIERQSRNKAGMDLTEDFIREIAGPFQRLATREDATKLSNVKIILRPGKSDSSPGYSVIVECPGSSPRIWHRPTIDNLNEIQKLQIEKLQTKGGFFQSSTQEMLEEIIKLRDYLSRIERVVREVKTEEAEKVRDIISPLQLSKE